MPEISQITFSYRDLVEILVKQQDLHEGIWGLVLKFGIQATNIGPNDHDLKPAAIIPVLEIGLQKMDKETNLTVDAAKVNPKPRIVRPSSARPS